MKKISLIVAALFFVYAGTAQNSGKITLTKGKQYNIVTDIKTHSVTTAMGQDMESEIGIFTNSNLSVDEVSSDRYKLTGIITKIKFSMSQMGQQMEYDTDAPDASSPLGGGLNEVINKPQPVSIDMAGKIVNEPASSGDDSPILKQLGTSGAGSKEAFLPLPGNLKAGDSFETQDEDEATGTRRSLKYTVKTIDDGVATLSFTGKAVTDLAVENQGMEINTKTEGTVEGETIVHVKSGVVQTTRTKGVSSGSISVMGQEMPITVNVDSVVTVKEI